MLGHKLKFSKLWDGSTFILEGRPCKKVSNAFSIDLLNGKDIILSPNQVVQPVHEKVLFRNFNIIA